MRSARASREAPVRSDRESAAGRPRLEPRRQSADPFAGGLHVPAPARPTSRGSVPGWDTGRGHLPAASSNQDPDRGWGAEQPRRRDLGPAGGQRYDEHGQQYAPEPRSARRSAPLDDGYGVPAPRSRPRPDPRDGRSARPPAQTSRVRGSLALLAMFVVTLVAAGADSLLGMGLGTITLIGLAVATTVAALVVRRGDLATIVVAPPLVFVVVAVVNVLIAPSASLNLATVATLLIRGFPAMGVATGIGLVLLLVRLVSRR